MTAPPPPPARAWKPAEDEKLLASWAVARPGPIASRLGRRLADVVARARALGLDVPGPPKRLRRWSEADDLALERDWTFFELHTIAARLGRSIPSVQKRAQHLKLGGTMRGRRSLVAFARATGYSEKRVRTAVRALGLRLPRCARAAAGAARHSRRGGRRWYALEEEHERTLLAFLASYPDGERIRVPRRAPPGASPRPVGPSWAPWPGQACPGPGGDAACATPDREHFSGGRCRPCYYRAYRAARAARAEGEAARVA
jgi:hypothetical protein